MTDGSGPRQPYDGPDRRSEPRVKPTHIAITAVATAVIAVVAVFGALRGGGDGEPAVVATTTTTAPAETRCPAPQGQARVTSFAQAPPFCIDPRLTYEATVTTDLGRFVIRLDPTRAPKTVNSFVVLARYGFYDGLPFNRVVKGFVVQTGDPTGDGKGGPGYTFTDEVITPPPFVLGSVAMVDTGGGAAGSQLFIVSGDRGTALPPTSPAFGVVTSGLDVLAAIDADGAADDAGVPAKVHRIEAITISG